MNKYDDNKLVEPMDAIILVNDNYKNIGLKIGDIGTVVENYIEKLGIILVDFSNPFTAKTIYCQAQIKTDDFRVVGSSKKDQELVRIYKNSFN